MGMVQYCWICQTHIETRELTTRLYYCEDCRRTLRENSYARRWFAAGERVEREMEIRRRMASTVEQD